MRTRYGQSTSLDNARQKYSLSNNHATGATYPWMTRIVDAVAPERCV
jgi:hypothetical protein